VVPGEHANGRLFDGHRSSAFCEAWTPNCEIPARGRAATSGDPARCVRQPKKEGTMNKRKGSGVAATRAQTETAGQQKSTSSSKQRK
jgi:hypothetical protein